MHTDNEKRHERITWLRYELAELIERCERHEIDTRQLAEAATKITSQQEIDQLADELLEHAFWAMHHAYQRPACWAPSAAEITYLKRCLRDEDVFDAAQIEFTLDHHD